MKRERESEAESAGMTEPGFAAWSRLCAAKHKVPCPHGDGDGCCDSDTVRAKMAQFIASMI